MIAENLESVRARIASAARRSGRDPADVRLVAVTKEVDADAARAAVDAGVQDLGENRVQELVRKRAALSDLDVRWHMIGTLQRNKVSQVVGNVVLIHSVDSVTLARTIDARARAGSARQDVLLEVNAGDEASKHGVATNDAITTARMLGEIRGIRLCGLMTVAPHGDADAARRAFRALRGLRDALRADAPEIRELSMGMSEDFEAAIEEGATIVRIGTAIFGPRARPYRANEERWEK